MSEQPLRAVEADAVTSPEGTPVTLHTDDGDVTVSVLPPGRWFTDATIAAGEARFDDWAEGSLSPEDFDAWMSVRKRNDDIQAFFEAWAAASGESLGKSRRSAVSSRSTPRR